MNAKILLGPSDFPDTNYEIWETKTAAKDAIIDERINELKSTSFEYVEDLVQQVVELIADNAKGEQDHLNRLLFEIWQHRNVKPKTRRFQMREQVLDELADIVNTAILEVIVTDVKEQFS